MHSGSRWEAHWTATPWGRCQGRGTAARKLAGPSQLVGWKQARVPQTAMATCIWGQLARSASPVGPGPREAGRQGNGHGMPHVPQRPLSQRLIWLLCFFPSSCQNSQTPTSSSRTWTPRTCRAIVTTTSCPSLRTTEARPPPPGHPSPLRSFLSHTLSRWEPSPQTLPCRGLRAEGQRVPGEGCVWSRSAEQALKMTLTMEARREDTPCADPPSRPEAARFFHFPNCNPAPLLLGPEPPL